MVGIYRFVAFANFLPVCGLYTVWHITTPSVTCGYKPDEECCTRIVIYKKKKKRPKANDQKISKRKNKKEKILQFFYSRNNLT